MELIVLAVIGAVVLLITTRRVTPLYVAVVSIQTAEDGGTGDETVNSARLYFDGGNTGGGINGHRVEFLVLDDRNDSAIAKQVAERIVADERQPQRDQ